MVHVSFLKLPEQRKAAILQSGTAEFAGKSYSDASTDEITKNCGISKGLLFHYFGSKRDFYLYCLEQALAKVVADTPPPEAGDFYGIIFSMMDEKIRLCRQFPDETRMVNMAARETGKEVQQGKSKLIAGSLAQTRAQSARTMARAVGTLRLKHADREKATAALLVYAGALMRTYLETYQEKPDEFFVKAGEIQREIREYLDLMLYGIVKED